MIDFKKLFKKNDDLKGASGRLTLDNVGLGKGEIPSRTIDNRNLYMSAGGQTGGGAGCGGGKMHKTASTPPDKIAYGGGEAGYTPILVGGTGAGGEFPKMIDKIAQLEKDIATLKHINDGLDLMLLSVRQDRVELQENVDKLKIENIRLKSIIGSNLLDINYSEVEK